MLERGVILDHRYELEGELGRGGAGVVFRARDIKLQRPVAVKALVQEGPVADRARFLEEARALAELRHPHILEVFEVGEDQGVPYLVVELAEHGSLLHRAARRGLPRPEVLRFARQVLQALEYAHEKGLVHRDIKPENVLLASEVSARLADFGLARWLADSARTATGVVLGTPEYLAPEVLRGERASEASDLFSWACLTLFLATGHPPHEGTALAIYRARIEGAYRVDRLRGPLRAAVERCLQSDPRARPAASELLEWIEGEVSSPSQDVERGASMDSSKLQAATRRVATRSRPAVPGGPRWWAAWGLGAAASGLLVMAALRPQALPALVPPAAPTEAARAPATGPRLPPVLLSRWRSRLRGFDPGLELERLQARVQPPAPGVLEPALSSMVHVMGTVRTGSRPEAVDLQELLASRARLPWRLELDADRAGLRGLLRDRAHPLAERLELLDLLERLRAVDAYYEAWGEEPAYLAEDLQAELIPRRIDAPGPLPAPAPTPSAKDPPPGRYQLFRWSRDPDRRHPYLMVPGPDLSPPEELARLNAQGAEGLEGWSVEEHQEALGRIHVARPERFGRVVLDLALAHCLVPNRILLRWNQVDLVYHPSPEHFPGVIWGNERDPWRRLRLELPPGLLQAGWNRLKVTTGPLPGLARWGCMWLDDVAIELTEVAAP